MTRNVVVGEDTFGGRGSVPLRVGGLGVVWRRDGGVVAGGKRVHRLALVAFLELSFLELAAAVLTLVAALGAVVRARRRCSP